MVDYGSNWSTAEVFCQRCHKQKPGISLKSMKMTQFNLSLDLCANCIDDIAEETKEFRV